MRARRLLAAACLVALGSLLGPGSPRAEMGERVYRLSHRQLDEAFLAIAELTGPRAQVSLDKAARSLTIRDEPERLQRIGELLERFDVPPRRVRLSLELIRAEKQEEAPGEPLQGVPANLRNVVTYNTFEREGQAELELDEAGSRELELGVDFRMRVTLGEVDPIHGLVETKLQLKRREPRGEGWRILSEYRDRLRAGELHMIGHTSPAESGRRMLFLLIRAEIEE